MDLYFQGLPPRTSAPNFNNALQPCMNALGILDWVAQTPPSGKRFGFVTFLDIKDANAFLQRHGAVPPQAPRFTISRAGVYVSKASRSPQELILKHLEHQRDQRAIKIETSNEALAVLPLRSISCGHIVFEGQGLPTFIRQTLHQCDLKATAKFGKRTLILEYGDHHRVDIPFLTMWDVIYDPNAPRALLILSDVPRFFTSGAAQEATQRLAKLDLVSNRDRIPEKFRLTHLAGCTEHAEYARNCLVYRIDFLTSYANFRQNMTRIRNNGIFEVTEFSVPDRHPIPNVTDYPTTLTDLNSRLGEISRKTTIPFLVLFQVQALVMNNYVSPLVGINLLEVLEPAFISAKREGRPPPYSFQSFKRLFSDIPYPRTDIDPEMVSHTGILSKLAELEAGVQYQAPFLRDLERGLSTRQSWVLKAMVTPTRITLHGPDLETNNRILRKFSDFTDYLLRVQFCEEDGEGLFFSPYVSNDLILERFSKVFNSGIPIAGRVYGFLGFSHSSLRSQSAWFSAPFFDHEKKLQSHNTIIQALGDFKHIRVPARCAARIGQAFSETPFSVSLRDHGIQQKYIPDVKSLDGTRVFSDGVGTISQGAVRALWSVLPKENTSMATCFQIRWAGAKGMLSLDVRLSGRQFCIRKESMEKFKGSDDSQLEICDMSSRPLRMVLNQQLIKIMEDLGVPDAWFLRLQRLELETLKTVTKTEESTAAFLEAQDIGRSIGLSKFIKMLKRWKIDYRMDRFMRSLVEAVVLRELRLLKHKARIPVRKGVTLFGVMDETGFLDEGQVYVTYDRAYRGVRGAVDQSLQDGPVLVTRSPALHPGDIQWAHQRTPPQGHPLRALENCIVFNQKGDRDLPSKLSGGDLDGDIYNIIFDPDISTEHTYMPADYPRVVAQGLDREVNKADMAQFFVDFMKSDQLGIIANRHLILADKRDQGTLSRDCLVLAEMHSCAVDFSKTGIAVDVSTMPNFLPKYRPDFLSPAPPTNLVNLEDIQFLAESETTHDDEEAAPNYLYYKSNKILGKLYRNIDERKIWANIHRDAPQGGPSVWEQVLGLAERQVVQLGLGDAVSWRSVRETARMLRDVYSSHIVSYRREFGPDFMTLLSELEVFCGTIFNKTGKQTRRQRDNSIKVKDKVNALLAWVVELLRTGGEKIAAAPDDATTTSGVAESEAGGVPVSGAGARPLRQVRAIELCLACLYVACEPRPGGGEGSAWDGEKAADSFKVVAGACLLRELNKFTLDMEAAGRRAEDGGYVGLRGQRR